MACRFLTLGDMNYIGAFGRCSHVQNNCGMCYNQYVSQCPIAFRSNELPKIIEEPSSCDNGTSSIWNNAALEESFKNMPSCLPMPNMKPADLSAQVHESTVKMLEELPKPEKENATGGVLVPAAESKKTPGEIPSEFDRKIVEYLKAHPKARTSDIRDHFNVKHSAVSYYLRLLESRGVIKAFKPPACAQRQGTSYEVIDAQAMNGVDLAVKTMVEKKTIETPTQKTRQLTEENGDAGGNVEKSLEVPSNIRKLIKEICHMQVGDEKNKKMNELIVEIIKETPGIGTSGVADKMNMSTLTIRNYLLDLEDAKRIERRMVPVEGGNAKIGYFAKGTC